MLLALLIGSALAAGTYAVAKKKNASNGQAGAAAAATGIAGLALITWWPLFLIGGAIAGGYFFGKRRHQKALPPARDV